MQTFLPYKDFAESAKVLDYRRLGKQRVETWQIYSAIVDGTGWRHHPIVKMWTGYEKALLNYGIIVCREWKSRGYNDTMLLRFESELEEYKDVEDKIPDWLDDDLCKSHQSNLLRKDNVYYSQFFKDVPNDLPYIWAVKR